MSWTFVTDVMSLSDPSHPHTIKRNDRGLYGCDCKAWRFSKEYDGAQRLCKHIKQVRGMALAPMPAVPIARPGMPGGFAAAASVFADKMKVKMGPRPAGPSVVANGLAPGRRMIALED